MSQMRKSIYLALAISTAAFAFSGYILLGLDDDGFNEVDPTLETKQIDEEIGFKQVANLIERFVRNQYERRKLEKNIDQYREEVRRPSLGDHSQAYRDLPEVVYATRDVHRKAHGCYKAHLSIRKDFIKDWNQTEATPIRDMNDVGIFKPDAVYDSIVRLSNGHPQNRDDRMPDARGFAVKILPRGSIDASKSIQKQDASSFNSATVLDILSINFPTFFVNEKNTALKYYEMNQNFLNGALDFSSPLKTKALEGLSVFSSGINAMEAQLALAVNGSIIKSPLFQEYFSMVPSRLGVPGSDRAVKYIWTPAACDGDQSEFEAAKKEDWPDWANERDYSHPLHSLDQFLTPPNRPFSSYEPNYLRANVAKRLSHGDVCFTLFVQPYLDQVSTNIEDSTDIWLRSEKERSWWKQKIVPSSLSPIVKALPFDRQAYLNRIDKKKLSPPVAVATLRIHQLNDQDIATNSKVCEDLSFNPWNGDIVHHKPLGVISRLKRRVYNASRRTRHALNGLQNLMPERKSGSEN